MGKTKEAVEALTLTEAQKKHWALRATPSGGSSSATRSRPSMTSWTPYYVKAVESGGGDNRLHGNEKAEQRTYRRLHIYSKIPHNLPLLFIPTE